MDREKEENRNDLIGDYQENKENQNAPDPHKPQAQEVHKTHIQNTGEKG